MVGLAIGLCLASSCGGSPTAATSTPGSLTIAIGPQVLRLTYSSFTCTTNGLTLFPMVYTRVTVSKSGNEWIVVSATPEAGDLEMRFHQTGTSPIGSTLTIDGTIRGQANHLPDLLPGVPASPSRMAFGGDGRTTVTGFAFGPSSLTPTGGVSGIGTGTVTLSDNTGLSCGGTAFTWGMAAQ